mgnify:CR=1 FL=1
MIVADATSSNPGQVHPVILCGGSGSRLWPLSRADFPKQLLPIADEVSMLQATAQRISFPEFASPLVIAGENHRFAVRDQLREVSAGPASIILEPEGRNTAAALGLAAHALSRSDPGALMLVLPSDHLIRDVPAFREAVRRAVLAAGEGWLVTFGLAALAPETGYGYIEAGEALEAAPGVSRVARFLEKPDRATAERLCADGRHHWNGGIFVMRADTYVEELERLAPEIAAACSQAMAEPETDGDFLRPGSAFLQAPPISVDYAIFEKTERAAVVRDVEMGWSDVGSWAAVWEVGAKDTAGNVVQGDVLAEDCHDCLFRSESGQLIAGVGLRDLAVISTRGALLVTPRNRAQDVKEIVARLEEQGSDLHLSQARVSRPWGTYETTDLGERYQTKRIVVKPGSKLSLQLHHHRSEHWIVVRGTARVTVGDRIVLLHENQSTFIPAGERHRLENPGKIPLELIEVQCGSYLGEDDIVRFQDDYGRQA